MIKFSSYKYRWQHSCTYFTAGKEVIMRFFLFVLLVTVVVVSNVAAFNLISVDPRATSPPQAYNLCTAHSDCRYFADDCFCGLGTDGLKHCYCIGTLP